MSKLMTKLMIIPKIMRCKWFYIKILQRKII